MRELPLVQSFLGVTFMLLLSLQMNAMNLPKEDTLNYKLINSLALKGEIKQILLILDTSTLTRKTDLEFRQGFRKRFNFRNDRSGVLNTIAADIRPLVRLYHTYWRRALLDTSQADHEGFRKALLHFLTSENRKARYTAMPFSMHDLDTLYKSYINHKGYFATDFGRTGFLYDLILWKDMKARPYKIELIDDTLTVPVYFIDSFVSLGWIAYSRMGKSSPGGWATREALYCVTNGYDTASEKFLLSYLKHEGQHFSDYKRFGELPAGDLEYRGKLLELYYGRSELAAILQSFSRGAKYDKTNAHPFANYCVIRDLSRLLFQKEWETDDRQWQSVPQGSIQQAAKSLYQQHTDRIRKKEFLE